MFMIMESNVSIILSKLLILLEAKRNIDNVFTNCLCKYIHRQNQHSI